MRMMSKKVVMKGLKVNLLLRRVDLSLRVSQRVRMRERRERETVLGRVRRSFMPKSGRKRVRHK